MLSAFSRVSRGRKSGGAFAIRALTIERHRANFLSRYHRIDRFSSSDEKSSHAWLVVPRVIYKWISKMRVRTRYQSANGTLIDIEVQKYSDKSAFYPREMKKRCIIFCQRACTKRNIRFCMDCRWHAIVSGTTSFAFLTLCMLVPGDKHASVSASRK